MKLVLASNSPRRRELLAGLEWEFSTRVMEGIDESYPDALRGEEIPLYIARKKAEAYRSTIADDELLITADTVVVLDGMVLGKPADEADAERMLGLLSGCVHQVMTGVSLTTRNAQRAFVCVTDVEFDTLSGEEIHHYVTKYKPFDKAGAYGIQEWIGFVGVRSIKGSFFNVMGLPVQRLNAELNKMMQ